MALLRRQTVVGQLPLVAGGVVLAEVVVQRINLGLPLPVTTTVRCEACTMRTMTSRSMQFLFVSVWRHGVGTTSRLWRAQPGTLLVPGHDLCMVLDASGQIQYQGERKAGIDAWFSESLAQTTRMNLCP